MKTLAGIPKLEKHYVRLIPLSLMLFNIVANMLKSSLQGENRMDALIRHLAKGGLSILQYAGDTILFMEHDLEKAPNMKLVLCIF
jgi:hypothetical protein